METINISYLKAHLSAVIERVRKGAKISILDRKLPVAIIGPLNPEETPLVMSYASQAPTLPPSIKNSVKIDVVKILSEERSKR